MKCIAISLGVLAALVASAQAGIIITVPDATLANTSGTGTLTVSAVLEGSYNVAGFGIMMEIAGRDGATGVSFGGASEASTNYLFTLPIGNPGRYGFAVNDIVYPLPGSTLYGDEAVRANPGFETIANTARNLITADLVIAPGTIGVFDVTLTPVFTSLNDTLGFSFEDQVLDDGVLTIVPEPLTICLFAPAVLWFASAASTRMRRRLASN